MKLKDVFKRGLAYVMTAAMLIGNNGFAMAADDTESAVSAEETAGEATVTEEKDNEDTAADADEADQDEEEEGTVQGAGGSRTKGDGTIENPWNLVYDEDVDGVLSEAGDYYFFETKADGVVSIRGCVPDGSGIPSGWITIWDCNGTVCLDDTVKGGDEYGFSTVENKSFGVKEGQRFLLRFYKAHENGYHVYRINIGFEKSDLWEAEPDSDIAPKKIGLNKEYNGVIISSSGDGIEKDFADHYTFSLKKKTSVEFYLSSAMASRIGLFKKNFKEDNKIEYAFNNSGNEAVITKTLSAGDYCIRIDTAGQAWTEYKLKVAGKESGGKSSPETGIAVLYEKDSAATTEVHSLKEAFDMMTEAKDYIVELKTDMAGEKPLIVPKKPASVTIYGNGHSIVIKGSKFTAKCPLTIEDVTIKTVNAKDQPAKLSFSAKEGLTVYSGVGFDAASTKIQAKKDMLVAGTLSANVLTADNLTIDNAQYIIGSGDKFTVNKKLSGKEGAEIYLCKGFKPLVLKGKVSGKITFDGEEHLPDGTQVISSKKKNITDDNLKHVFDCTDLTSNTVYTYLSYCNGKACIFGESIEFCGSKYCLWSDAVNAVNTNVKSGMKELSVDLIGDVNCMGKFVLPKKGYEKLTINGNGHTMTFTSDIKLTGDLTISTDTKLVKVNKKNEKAAGKIKNGKYTYEGPQINQD
ncbi:MAG: hypothetical protein IKR23_09720 [Lachnospiraceae bacterium]|nr:hypothetical protein [Lachnospiraceae bacterium]